VIITVHPPFAFHLNPSSSIFIHLHPSIFIDTIYTQIFFHAIAEDWNVQPAVSLSRASLITAIIFPVSPPTGKLFPYCCYNNYQPSSAVLRQDKRAGNHHFI
jgi:hypothetical protein